MSRSDDGAPRWAWFLAFLPWVWVIPFNQYFWDDWSIAAQPGLDGQLSNWAGGAKHFLNPWIYAALLPLGAWVFHVITFAANGATAVSLARVVSESKFLDEGVRKWIGPVFLVLPVFHGRFSVATLEYSVGLAALFGAWALLLGTARIGRLVAYPLLVFAIGVPSLALLYPLAYFHVAWSRRECSGQSLGRALLFDSPIILIPASYSLIFRFLVDDREKYQISTGALVEFLRGLVVLTLVLFAAVWILYRRYSRPQVELRWLSFSLFASYVGLFPYYAVGYNPLSDFLPWRYREEVVNSLGMKLLLAVLAFTAIAIFANRLALHLTKQRGMTAGWVAVLSSATFSILVYVFGPMDWESRHWLISWPFLALSFVLLPHTQRRETRWSANLAAFLVLLAGSLAISSEYLVDVLKQRSFVSQLKAEVSDDFITAIRDNNQAILIIQPTETTDSLNARFRGYRRYEWAGLVGQALQFDASRIRVLATADLTESLTEEACTDKYEAWKASPEVLSSRVDALTGFRVKTRWDLRQVSLCRVGDTWGLLDNPQSTAEAG